MSRWRLSLVFAILASLTLTLGAGVAYADQNVTVTLSEFTIEPSAINVQAGEQVNFTLNNAGKFPHDLHVEGQGVVAEAVEGDGNIASGESATWQWTPTQPGTYQMWCPVGPHRENGMVGTITVTAAGVEAPAALPATGSAAPTSIVPALGAGVLLLGLGALLRRRRSQG